MENDKLADRTKIGDMKKFYDTIYGIKKITTKKDEEDFEAWYFAMCFLLPKEAFMKKIESLGGLEEVMISSEKKQYLAEFFHVDKKLITVRLKDLMDREKKKDNILMEDNILNLVIGEDIPNNSTKEFSQVKLYVRDGNNNLNLYADIKLPYLINHCEFLDIEDDPRYFFKEGYDPETKGCKYLCEIKPLGELKGVYRILNGQSLKIRSIDPLCSLEEIEKVKVKK